MEYVHTCDIGNTYETYLHVKYVHVLFICTGQMCESRCVHMEYVHIYDIGNTYETHLHMKYVHVFDSFFYMYTSHMSMQTCTYGICTHACVWKEELNQVCVVVGYFEKEPCILLRYAQSRVGKKYGVASISRLLKIIGLFCKRAL